MSFNADSRPILLWPLDIQSISHQGEDLVVLKDPRGIGATVVLPKAALPILARFNGEVSLGEIVREGEAYGVTLEFLRLFAKELESHSLLDNEITRGRWEDIKSAFSKLAVRPMAFAGKLYPKTAEDLEDWVRRYLEKFPGIAFKPSARKISAMMAPHIDYNRGAGAYSSAYRILSEIQRPDVVFLIGTSHQYSEELFHLSSKAFATPVGSFPSASEIVREIALNYGAKRCFKDEILHKDEHSLELVLPFLAHRFKDEKPPAIVPILVGSFHRFLGEVPSLMDVAEISDFIEALAQQLNILQNAGQGVLFCAGVDLAHVGRHFGDSVPVNDEFLADVRQRDMQFVDAVLSCDEQEVFAHVEADMDRRRLCGFPSLYTMIASMARSKHRAIGQLIDYQMAVDKTTDCVVSFATACWEQ